MSTSTFESTSSEIPLRIVVSFANDPAASLGASLTNYDRGGDHEIFVPSYAAISELVEGDTVARKCGVSPGDYIVAVNDLEFRRFPALISNYPKQTSNKSTTHKFKRGEGYATTFGEIKQIKSRKDPENPLILTLE
eukprot:scaffold582_cov286-Chaetoceros_neogracile.AAC.1